MTNAALSTIRIRVIAFLSLCLSAVTPLAAQPVVVDCSAPSVTISARR